ncbi:GTPase [Ordospora pajunii]|uniref:GTPase n=1 Tax=Ordospora pajunii TaxID=3039483 RepID=UPI0029528B08|nr:GTPase [Ordospora pajunii]KAH9411987.1 GTPase [Ordospora pajunii]
MEERSCTKSEGSGKKIFVVVGMAGSGKTTFCQRLYSWISQERCSIDKCTGLNSRIYSMNLDPAVVNSKMPLNLDIRDVVDYHEVMEKYNLGPNGGITTCLNLFMLDIGKYLNEMNAEYVIVDTPGQIEAFTWSSPGYVLIEALKGVGEVVVVYVVDSVASHRPAVFMSNMMYAASLMCRYESEVLCVFNKKDLEGSERLNEWIRDYEKFQQSLDNEDMFSPILGSMALHFEEFYNTVKTVSVSSYTGEGRSEFFDAVGISTAV